LIIGRNPRFVTLIAARKVDLYGRIGLHMGKSNLASGPAEVMAFINGAELSEGRLVGEEKKGRIIAEARCIKIPGNAYAEIVFVVDETYQRLGIASPDENHTPGAGR